MRLEYSKETLERYKRFGEKERNFMLEHGEEYLTDVAKYIDYTRTLRNNPGKANKELNDDAMMAIISVGITENIQVACSVALEAYKKQYGNEQAENAIIDYYLKSLGCTDSASLEKILPKYLDKLKETFSAGQWL